jgi:hypothetical protein
LLVNVMAPMLSRGATFVIGRRSASSLPRAVHLAHSPLRPLGYWPGSALSWRNLVQSLPRGPAPDDPFEQLTGGCRRPIIVAMQTPNEPRRALRLDAYPDYEEAFEELEQDGWLWVREELSHSWREARLEASLAYSHWCRIRDRTAYSIYRAAQDRADAAQDELSRRHAAEQASEAVAR